MLTPEEVTKGWRQCRQCGDYYLERESTALYVEEIFCSENCQSLFEHGDPDNYNDDYIEDKED